MTTQPNSSESRIAIMLSQRIRANRPGVASVPMCRKIVTRQIVLCLAANSLTASRIPLPRFDLVFSQWRSSQTLMNTMQTSASIISAFSMLLGCNDHLEVAASAASSRDRRSKAMRNAANSRCEPMPTNRACVLTRNNPRGIAPHQRTGPRKSAAPAPPLGLAVHRHLLHGIVRLPHEALQDR